MTNKFKIGDKVKFLRSNDFGVVESIISERKLKVMNDNVVSLDEYKQLMSLE